MGCCTWGEAAVGARRLHAARCSHSLRTVGCRSLPQTARLTTRTWSRRLRNGNALSPQYRHHQALLRGLFGALEHTRYVTLCGLRACRACRACVCVVARELQLELSACLLLFCCAVQGALNIERHNVLSMEELRRIDQPPTRYKTDGGGGVSHLAQALVAPGKARLKGAFAAGVLR